MTFTKRQATMSIKHKVEYLDNAKQTFFDTIKQMKDFKIPDNRDQTGLNMVFHCFWTIQHKGAKQVNVAGLGIKRHITALFCLTLTLTVLTSQLTNHGSTTMLHTNIRFSTEWAITHSANH